MATIEQDFSLTELETCLEISKSLGFLSPQPIENQINHSREFLSLIPEHGNNVIDLGAGGGLPSLVWLNMNSHIKLLAIDAMRKRTDFLESVKENYQSLNDRLDVINGRAEELSHREDLREKFDLVVARGFGAPPITAECAAGFIKPGGILVVSGRPENEIARWDKAALESLELSIDSVRDGEFSHAVILTKQGSLSNSYPRNAALMKKKPLWVPDVPRET